MSVAILEMAIGFSSCHPIEEPTPPSIKEYVLELSASVCEFGRAGGTSTITATGITFTDNIVTDRRILDLSELNIVLIGGEENFLQRDGLTFTVQPGSGGAAYYKVTWKEKGISRQLLISRAKS